MQIAPEIWKYDISLGSNNAAKARVLAGILGSYPDGVDSGLLLQKSTPDSEDLGVDSANLMSIRHWA